METYVSPKRWYLPTNPRGVTMALKKETVYFSEMLISTYESTRRHSPKEQQRQY
jgi:hypothetical protein